MSPTPAAAPTEPREARELAWDRYWSEVYRPGSEHPGAFTRWALPLLRSVGARTVLDLGCGPGRDLRFLLEQGFLVTGVDGSSVALGLAEGGLARLPAEVGRRARLVHAGVLEHLASTEAESVDAVHAAATYQGFEERELARTFNEVHRVLVPGGMHVWSVRSARHVGSSRPETIPPNFVGLGFTVPVRFVTLEETRRLAGDRFERLAFEETSEFHGFYLADRKRSTLDRAVAGYGP